MGVQHMVVCIDKIDDPTVKYFEAFDKNPKELSIYLKQVGYNSDQMKFISNSGL